jgi:uncharacterized protein (DUF3084 family)
MAEAPEIPEANDPFEKQVAVTIACLAVVLAVIGNKGDNAKTDAIIKTNEASNQWGYFQAKGIKGSIATSQGELLTMLAPSQNAFADIAKKIEALKADAERYKDEQKEIKTHAEEAQKDAGRGSQINDRCDQASLALQVAIVVASIAILSRMRAFWIISIVLGLAGAAIGVLAFLI